MKHTNYFDTFLRDTVNLSKFNLDVLEDKATEVYTALKVDDDLGSKVLSMKRQGSWAQRTIITPQPSKEFDADIMVRLRYDPAWTTHPSKYSNAIYNAIAASPVLSRRQFERHARCVRIHYDGMHVDVVPYTVFPDGTERIIDRDTNQFEITDPSAFTDWMRARDEYANKNLRKVIRIIKHLRDHKGSFTGTPSIILTTLLGNQVNAVAKVIDPSAYDDVPSTLLTLVTDLEQWLDGYTDVPTVRPQGLDVDFSHRWKPESFRYFKARLAVHRAEMYEAFHELDHDRSVEKWQALFGDGFTAPASSSPGKFSTGTGAGTATTTGRGGRAG